MSDDMSSLLPALVDLLSRVGSSPIKLHVALSDPEEITKLKEDLVVLQTDLKFTREKLKRTEVLYAGESALNNRLIDYMRSNGLSVPPSFFKAVS